MFSERKLAQVAAFFTQAEGGQIAILKLIKLMYLSDRESLDRYGDAMTYDVMYCMKDGPVLSRTLDYVNGLEESSEDDGWDAWIAGREDKEVALVKNNISRESLDELSNAEIHILHDVWGQFGHMNKWEIRDYTHEHCPEWKKPPGGGRTRLPYREVLKALGKTPEQIKNVGDYLRENYYFDKILPRA